jgi:uncharacterized RDD family membrane protein YckC
MENPNATLLTFPSSSTAAALAKKKHKKLLSKRTYAFATDLLLIAGLSKLMFWSYVFFLRQHMGLVDLQMQGALFLKLNRMSLPLLMATFCAYFWGAYYLGHGRTIGKVIFGLRVVPRNGSGSISMRETFLRGAGYFMCYGTGSLLFALPYFTKDQRGLPDFLSGTKVVEEADWQASLNIVPSHDLLSIKEAA